MMSNTSLIPKNSSISIEWCGETHLLPYGLTHQAHFQQWLTQAGFFGSCTLRYKVFCGRKHSARSRLSFREWVSTISKN